jgi:signal transduction histidine kinase
MEEDGLSRLVTLACHDLRTPLATVDGVAKLLVRRGELSDEGARLAGLIDGAAAELASLIDQLSVAARIASGQYEPRCRDVEAHELAAASDERIAVTGRGETVSTAPEAVSAALERLAIAALRYGDVPAVTWTVTGRTLILDPLAAAAAPVVEGSSPRDLGALVARMVIEALGGTVGIEEGSLRVELGTRVDETTPSDRD